MKKIFLIFCFLMISNAVAQDESSYYKLSTAEREKVYKAISKLDVLIDFYQEDIRKFTSEESPEILRAYLLSLASMKVRMKLMMRLPFQLTSNLKDLQEMKNSLSQKSLDDLVQFVESGKI